MLLNTNGKRNAWAVRQVNAERIGIARGQIACIHVEVPHPTREGEGNVGNGRVASFVDLVDGAPNLARHSKLATLGIIQKDRIRIGNGLASGIAHSELDRDCASTFSLVNAAAVTVNRRQDNASRVRSAASAITDREVRPVIRDRIVA